MEEMQKPSLGARVKAWPLWAKIVAVVVVVWLVYNVAAFAVSQISARAVHKQFDDFSTEFDK